MNIIGVILVIFFAVQIAVKSGLSRIEQQPYKVLAVFRQFEIRNYPESLIAQTVCTGNKYKAVARTGFNKVAGFIFGKNSAGKKIPMTAPVRIEFGSEFSKVEFVMPLAYSASTLPKSLDASVQIKTWPGGNYAAIRFGGFPNDQKIRKAIEALKAELTVSGISFKDEPVYLGYNPPYQIMFRRNEVIIPVEWKEAEQKSIPG